MPDLQRVWLIARREWITRLKTRAFQLTTVFQVLVIVVLAALPAIVAAFSSDDGPGAQTILVVDEAGVDAARQLLPYLDPAVVGDPGVGEIRIAAETVTADQARDEVEDGKVDGALIVSRGADQHLAFTWITEQEDDLLTQRVAFAASTLGSQDRLAEAGISEAQFVEAMAGPSFVVENATGDVAEDEDEITGTEIAISTLFTVLTFMAIMLYGTWVAQGVVEEKSSRIMEIMINAATPKDLLAGKILGIGMAGLTQLLPMLLTGGIVFASQKPLAKALGGDAGELPDLEFGSLSIRIIGFFLIYFILGFITYAAMYAALGSMVSRQEDVNTAIAPMMTIMMIGYLGALFTLGSPESMAARILSLFPLTAPFGMMPRIILGSPPAWEIALSLVTLSLTLVLMVLLAARLYRIGVLMYGQKPSFRSLFKSGVIRTAR